MDSTNYLIIQISFAALTLFSIGWFVKDMLAGISTAELPAEQKGKLKFQTLTGLIIWLLVVCVLSLSGFLSNFTAFPPRLTVVLVVPFFTILFITFSSSLKEIVRNIPPRNLLRLQVFRVFVEILLWRLFVENLLPVQMTFEGRNFDVLAGILGPLVAYVFKDNKKVMIVYNVIGLCLLLNIVTIAILSIPGTPFRYFMNEPANTIVTYFPIVLLPAFLVPLAYTLHFFSLRQLLSKD
jgi:hypothetical protein